jgi:hypothetical protein
MVTISATTVDVSGIILSLAFLTVVVGVTGMAWLVVTARRCPCCNEPLHEVKVNPLDGSMPPGSKWYCSNCKPTLYFSDLDEKPAPFDPEPRP